MSKKTYAVVNMQTGGTLIGELKGTGIEFDSAQADVYHRALVLGVACMNTGMTDQAMLAFIAKAPPPIEPESKLVLN